MTGSQFFCMGATDPSFSGSGPNGGEANPENGAAVNAKNVTDIREWRMGRLLAYDKERDDRQFADAMRRAAERFQEAS